VEEAKEVEKGAESVIFQVPNEVCSAYWGF
jgi:hypothetical protein